MNGLGRVFLLACTLSQIPGEEPWRSPFVFHPFVTFGYPDVAAIGGAVALPLQESDDWRIRHESGPCVAGRLGLAMGQIGVGWQFGDSGKFGPAVVRVLASGMTAHDTFSTYQRGDRFVGMELQGQAMFFTLLAGFLHGIDSDDGLVVMGIGFGL